MAFYRWLTVCLLFLVGVVACTPPVEPVAVTRPLVPLATAVSPTPPLIPTQFPLATATPEPTMTVTPWPQPSPSATPTAETTLSAEATAVPNQSTGISIQPIMSADGTVIAFISLGALTPNADADWAAYAREVVADTTELLNVRHDGQPAYDDVYGLALSADGRFAAYYSFDGEITPDDPDLCTDGDWTEPCEDLYVYNRKTGQVERIPVGRPSGLGKSYTIALSADGRYVAYENLQIYDRQTGQMVNIFGETPNRGSFAPTFAANGDIAFVSTASNLVANDTNDAFDVFVWDAETRQISRVSIASDGSEGNDLSGALPLHEGTGSSIAISGNGRFVAFASLATNLTTINGSQCEDFQGNRRLCYNIYLHDRDTGQTQLMASGNGDSLQPALSDDGRFLAFASSATNLMPNTPHCANIALTACGQIYLLDTQTGDLQAVSKTATGEWGSRGSLAPDISADGRYLTFASEARNLVPGDTNNVGDIFLYDAVTGEIELISLKNE